MYLLYFSIFYLVASANTEYTYETKWFTVPLDHFGFQRNETFRIKYLVNDTYWDKDKGPIFFYAGHEGPIEVFAKHIGFMWDIAAEFQAKLVFAEHRYYGASMPFGDKSRDNAHVGYLTSQQTLADYADLINFLQNNKIKPKYPVIAFGGCYGGMLTAYLRIKYPHLVNGAIAASAPVHMFTDMVPCSAFSRIVTYSFSIPNPKCVDNIRRSWAVLRNFIKLPNNTDWLKTNWNLCVPLNNEMNTNMLFQYLRAMYETLAMVNYPYPYDYMVPLPAHPVRVVCQYLNQTLNGQQLLEGIGKILQVFSNYNGRNKCVDYVKGYDYGDLDITGWYYQSCTEMVVPMCTNNVDDMFEERPWNFTQYSEYCYQKYNVRPNPDLAKIEYGGSRLQAASNIVFSNGLLDPWAAGGIFNSISDTVRSVIIGDGALHVDLMPSNPADTPSVQAARNIHKENIRQWISQFWEQQQTRQKNRF